MEVAGLEGWSAAAAENPHGVLEATVAAELVERMAASPAVTGSEAAQEADLVEAEEAAAQGATAAAEGRSRRVVPAAEEVEGPEACKAALPVDVAMVEPTEEATGGCRAAAKAKAPEVAEDRSPLSELAAEEVVEQKVAPVAVGEVAKVTEVEMAQVA